MFRLWFMTFKGKKGEAAEHAHESPLSMTLPLMILAVFAALSGFLMFVGLNDIITFNVISGEFIVGGHGHGGMEILKDILTNVWTYVSIALALFGIALAYIMYERRLLDPARFNADGKSGLYRFLTARYYFPQLYDQISLKLGYGVAKGVEYVDSNLIDGTVNGLANSVIGTSGSMRRLHSGYVRDYASFMVIGVIAIFVILYILVTSGGF
jgi:NADH-quinone oxidoreductase subunit L